MLSIAPAKVERSSSVELIGNPRIVSAAKMDFRPGGRCLYGLKTPDGGAMWGRFIYREIDARSRIALVSSFSDETGGVTRHPMSASWPLEMLSLIELESEGDRTTMTGKPFGPHHCAMRSGSVSAFHRSSREASKLL